MAACAGTSSSRSASTSTSRAAELPPPSPEFSQAATLKSFREAGKLGDGSSEAGKLGGLTLRSEGKVIKQSQTFSLTLQVEEPSVLAFRWSSVTDGPLHFSAAITGTDGQGGGMASVDLAPQEARATYRSGALDVSVGTCTFSWDNRSALFERAVSYCVVLCPNRELCDEQRLQAEASAREQRTALCAAIVERAVDAAARAGRLRVEAAAEEAAAAEARATGMGQQAQAAEVQRGIELAWRDRTCIAGSNLHRGIERTSVTNLPACQLATLPAYPTYVLTYPLTFVEGARRDREATRAARRAAGYGQAAARRFCGEPGRRGRARGARRGAALALAPTLALTLTLTPKP